MVCGYLYLNTTDKRWVCYGTPNTPSSLTLIMQAIHHTPGFWLYQFLINLSSPIDYTGSSISFRHIFYNTRKLTKRYGGPCMYVAQLCLTQHQRYSWMDGGSTAGVALAVGAIAPMVFEGNYILHRIFTHKPVRESNAGK